MTTPTVRPGGVTVMAIIAGIAGAIDVATGLGDIAIGGGLLTDLGFGANLDTIMTVVGVVLVIVGILGLTAASGLWRLSDTGWLLARLWASVSVVVGLVGAGLSLLGDSISSQILAAAAGAAVPAVLAAIVLWYLYQPDVKKAFRRP
jgi:hypothetical protein